MDEMTLSKKISRRKWFKWAGIGGMALPLPLLGQGDAEVKPLPAGPHVECVPCSERPIFERVTLEMSLKPFFATDEKSIRSVCESAFRQWSVLTSRADACAVMLWTADGSEILVYRGQMSDEIEWGRYIGIANPRVPPPRINPSKLSIHQRARLYTAHPAKITYGTLKRIIETFKAVGRSMTGKPVEVGATFDPGPEFARSPFKYEKHREILKGMWVDCTSVLSGDSQQYAGFPKGVPQGTPFGKFFGRQSQHFLADLGFDYIWFSNGFGFSATAWSVKGPLFDGQGFHPEKAGEIRNRVIRFWEDFRKECPSYRVETRGSNLSTGADLSASASPIRDIYDGGFNMVAPPNSPWAAIDGDFGLEISGYLSHIAHLPPGDKFPFRFYVNDPWWDNSPWFDRYDQQPHDIYLPLALARLDREGKVTPPSYLEFLTIDNSFGELPVEAPIEITPHIIKAMGDYSDAPGLITWIYPFREFNADVFGKRDQVGRVFFSDWFMRNAVNAGLPVNTIVSAENFLASSGKNTGVYQDTILLTLIPAEGSRLEHALLEHLHGGGNVFLYGSVRNASQDLLDLLNLKLAAPLKGDLKVQSVLAGDAVIHGPSATHMLHRDVLSDGGIDTAVRQLPLADFEVCSTVSDGSSERVFAAIRSIGKGRIAWVRGSLSSRITKAALPQPDDPKKWFQAEYLMRYMLSRFGYDLQVEKPNVETRTPLVLVASSNNGFFFSGYCPSTTATIHLRFPHGAPILHGYETWFENGRSKYNMPRAWHQECRFFIEQAEAGVISCIERIAEEIGIRRRILVTGLKNATLHFYPEIRPAGPPVRMELGRQQATFFEKTRRVQYSAEEEGRRLVARNITGDFLVSW